MFYRDQKLSNGQITAEIQIQFYFKAPPCNFQVIFTKYKSDTVTLLLKNLLRLSIPSGLYQPFTICQPLLDLASSGLPSILPVSPFLILSKVSHPLRGTHSFLNSPWFLLFFFLPNEFFIENVYIQQIQITNMQQLFNQQ